MAGNLCKFISIILLLTIAVAPSIMSIDGSRTNLVVGEMLSVACIAEGFPIPDVTWFHNGTRLENCTEQLRRIPAVCAEYRNPSAILLIIFAKLNDSGQYVCTAENFVGSTSYSVFISVRTPTSMLLILYQIQRT
jgi:hypothetical protein